MENFVYTYPFNSSRCNLVNQAFLHDFEYKDLYKININEKINDSFIFLTLEEFCFSDDTDYIKKIFKNLLRNNYLIIYHSHSANVNLFVKRLRIFLEGLEIDYKKIFIILYLPSDAELLKQKLSVLGLEKINVTYRFGWLIWTKHNFTPEENIDKKYRFSVFTRRFSDWRYELYLNLIENDVLDNTVFTFSKSHPDCKNSDIPKEVLKERVSENYNKKDKIHDWIDSLPIFYKDIKQYKNYSVSDIIFRKLQESYLHIVCETHVDFNFNGVMLTEKIFKPIVSSRPFIVVGRKGTLELLRSQGFKTFHPIINEEYDTIEDDSLRIKAVCEELKRMNRLPFDEFLKHIHACQAIVDHNLQIANRYYNEDFPENYKKLNIFG